MKGIKRANPFNYLTYKNHKKKRQKRSYRIQVLNYQVGQFRNFLLSRKSEFHSGRLLPAQAAMLEMD